MYPQIIEVLSKNWMNVQKLVEPFCFTFKSSSAGKIDCYFF